MKITPVVTGQSAQPQALGGVATNGASSERLESAKSIAMGQGRITPSETPVDPQVEKMKNSIRSLRMKTNSSPDRAIAEEIMQAATAAPAEAETQSVIAPTNEGVIEETKPLSSQAAAIARQRRALQVKEREILLREEALKTKSPMDGGSGLEDRLKTETLRVLQEKGLLTPEFYNSMTEYLTSGQGYNPELEALKTEIKTLKAGVDKTLSDRDIQAEQQVLAEMRKEADFLAKDGETFELIRETQSVPQAIELIHRTYKQTGEVMDVREAMQLIEDELFEQNLKIAGLKKIQAKISPPANPEIQLQTQPKGMKTLTNRDTAQSPMDRRTRAMLAAQGLLK